jgi:hypothetical protein
MKLRKIIASVMIVLLFTGLVVAQEKTTRSETTVEQEYLSTVEDIIIKELSAADDFDTKLVALQHIESALAAGRASPQIQESLQALAGEGVLNQSRTNGRLANNYPDVRKKACELLGQVGTPEAKNALLKVSLADTEPMVISSAVRALGDIGINEEDDVVNTIAWIQRRFSVLNPTDSLAFEILEAFEKLAPTVEDNALMIESIAAIASNYRFVTPVRTKALDLLAKLSSN